MNAHPFAIHPLACKTALAAACVTAPGASTPFAAPRRNTRIGSEDAKLLDKLSARAAAAAGKVRALTVIW